MILLISLSGLALQLAYAPLWDISPQQVEGFRVEQKVEPEEGFTSVKIFNQYKDLVPEHLKKPADVFEAYTSGAVSMKAVQQYLYETRIYDELTRELMFSVAGNASFIPAKELCFALQRQHTYRIRLQVRYYLDRGEIQPVLDYTLLWLSHCQKSVSESSPASMLDGMIRVILYEKALGNLEDLLPSLAPDQWAEAVKILEETPDLRKFAWKLFEGEFRFMKKFAQENILTFKSFSYFFGDFPFDLLPIPPLLYQPNRTLNAQWEDFQIWKPFLTAPLSHRKNLPYPALDLAPLTTPVRFYNFYGRKLIQLNRELNIFEDAVRACLEKETRAAALRVSIRLMQGESPPFRDLLDPYTGHPIHVRPDLQAVISAGKDQTLGSEDDLEFKVIRSLKPVE